MLIELHFDLQLGARDCCLILSTFLNVTVRLLLHCSGGLGRLM